MNASLLLMSSEFELIFIWNQARPEGKAIIVLLILFSIFAWAVMASKAMQMRRACHLNGLFDQEFRGQKGLLSIFNQGIPVDGCPLYSVYESGCRELQLGIKRARERHPESGEKVRLKSIKHVKHALERAVSQESLQLESGLILLAIAVSGAPFLGLLGTVWGVMSTFAEVAQAGNAQLTTMAPGVAAALVTTVAGLLVAIPSMFGYNWLVHHLRVLTVDMDNFAHELASKIEIEFLNDV
ncbi:MAG: Biopolymer transport protein ExbB [Verrucomicrobia subdivision 3 bacterium]|nr:Biopolymer transport protein ExbB [Limisphaerales bacterium]MCS1413838.1 Biopolymer transport protein ExbB [Limisphaerales bacterium]